MLTLGQILKGKYRILRSLGGGSFGQTYLTEDVQMQNQYAIKQLKPFSNSAEILEIAKRLFEWEAKVLKKVRNPLIENIFRDYAQISYRYGDLKNQVIINRDSDSYLLMTVGWSSQKRVHYCLLHIDIIDGKIWIQRDGTEDGIAIELVMAGIPKDQIVLAFHPAEIKQHTEFAVT